MSLPEPRRPEPPAPDEQRRRPSSVVAYDEQRRELVVGDRTAPLGDPADREAVYAAYLSLLRAVRGAERGQVLPLRDSDVEALIALVGDDPRSVEGRLVELMGCTRDEAELLGRVLVRHRVFAGAAGLAAVLSLVALPAAAGGSARAGDGTRPAVTAQAAVPPATLSSIPVAEETAAAPAATAPAASVPAATASPAAAAPRPRVHVPAPRPASEPTTAPTAAPTTAAPPTVVEAPPGRSADVPVVAVPVVDVPTDDAPELDVPTVDVPADTAALPTGVDLSEDLLLDDAARQDDDGASGADPTGHPHAALPTGVDLSDDVLLDEPPASQEEPAPPASTGLGFWPYLPAEDGTADAA